MSGDWAAAGAAIADRRKAKAIDRAAARLREEFPGVAVTVERDAIILSGRGLMRRWARDARLRAIGSIVR